MTQLKIDNNKAREIYPTATPFVKMILEQSFPDGYFNGNIIDRTPTVEAALAIAGKTIEGLTRSTDAPHETAGRIIEAFIEVLWEGKQCMHSDKSQDKYEPRFIHDSGVGLRYLGCAYWRTTTGCGPRLCYPSYDSMAHGVKILEPYYIKYINFK